MMRHLILAAAALALVACNQQSGSGPALPAPQEGVQLPSTQTPPQTPPQRAQIDDATRTRLRDSIAEGLNQVQGTFAQGMTVPNGMQDEIVTMEPATDHRVRFNMTGGVEYRIIGVCDGDCANVDIELIDSRGGVVMNDMLPDNYPVVSYTAQTDGVYYARLLMQNCTVAPCFAGVRILAAPGAAAAKP